MQHGLLEGSFVPPRPIQQLRDLTRSRTTLKQEQVRIGNRIRKVAGGRQYQARQRPV